MFPLEPVGYGNVEICELLIGVALFDRLIYECLCVGIDGTEFTAVYSLFPHPILINKSHIIIYH